MNGTSTVDKLALLELIDMERWQRLQDHFSRVLGVAIRTITPSNALLTNPSWPASVDADRVISVLRIGEELAALLPEEAPPQEVSSLTTALGVTYALVPVRATAEQIVGYFVVGPMVVGPREEEGRFRQRVQSLGQDAQALWPILLALKVYTFAGIRSALTLLEEVGTSIAQLAYQGRQLTSFLPSTTKIGRSVVAYHTDRILYSLLEAAVGVTKADGGSVMMYDPQERAWKVTAAHGLSNEVIATTRAKPGEGLAGLAVERRSILLVDDRAEDPRILERMQRRGVTSSLVAPLTSDSPEDPVGVLNLRTTSPEKRFTKEHAEMLRQLLGLAGAALSSLRFSIQGRPAA